MSDTLPNEVREAMDAAVARLPTGIGPSLRALIIDAALSALEAAGWEVNRKGTREALELASRRLDIAASRMGTSQAEHGLRMWAEEARTAWRHGRASNPKEKPDV